MIREIRPEDAQAVRDLTVQLDPENAAVGVAPLADHIGLIQTEGATRLYGWDDGGTIVGMYTLGLVSGITAGLRPFAVVENVVVSSACRSSGIGKAMMRDAIDRARNLGCYKVILETGTKDDWKLKFYDDCGFSRGEKTAYIKRF